jgi:hypothetical protein
VDERGSGHQAQGNLAGIDARVQCLADWLRAKLTGWACRTKAHLLPTLLWTKMPRFSGFLRVLLTGPFVANANAGRDTFRQPDFQRRAYPLACSSVEIGTGIIRSDLCPIELRLTPHPRRARFCRAGFVALAPPPT